jgi:hypothetical protein
MPVSVADDGVDAIHAFTPSRWPRDATLEEQRTAADQERIGLFLDKARKGGIDFATPEKAVLFDRLVG